MNRTGQATFALFGVMALAACSGSDSDEPTAAEQVADQYLDAVNAYDIPKVTTLLAAGGEIDGMEDWRLTRELPLWQSQGFTMVNESCNELGATPAGAKVVCTFDFHRLGSDELGLGPYPGNFYEFTVAGQTIVDGSEHIEVANQFGSEVWTPFQTWAEKVHPELVDIAFTDAEPTPQTVAAWEQLRTEFVAAQKAKGQTVPAE